MIQFSGTIMLSMFHHRKVNQSILYILLLSYFSIIPFFLVSYFTLNQYLLLANVVIILAAFVFGVSFYCEYANHEYPNSEILEPSELNEKQIKKIKLNLLIIIKIIDNLI